MDTLNQLIDKFFGKLLTIEIGCHLIGKIFEVIGIQYFTDSS